MLGFVQNWLTPKANPIGVDFGSDCLRLAQVQWTRRRVPARSPPPAPTSPRTSAHDPAAPAQVLRRDRPRPARPGRLPAAASASWRCRRRRCTSSTCGCPRWTTSELSKALPLEARGKLPIDPGARPAAAHRRRRRLPGPGAEERSHRDGRRSARLVNQFLAAAAKAKLDVVGMNVEPKALRRLLHARVPPQERRGDRRSCFVDIGCGATRAMIIARRTRSCSPGRSRSAATTSAGRSSQALKIRLDEAQAAADQAVPAQRRRAGRAAARSRRSPRRSRRRAAPAAAADDRQTTPSPLLRRWRQSQPRSTTMAVAAQPLPTGGDGRR